MGQKRKPIRHDKPRMGRAVQSSIQSLVALGFTPLEAEVYTFLVQESPVTGYRVAQALGKTAPHIYNALDSLKRKGAVLVEDGQARLCRATPIDELLGQLERRFLEDRAQAQLALARLPSASGDERVYQLTSRDQVFERCRSMLRDCTSIALLDISPSPLLEIAAELEAAVQRGIEVAIRTDEPVAVPGATVVVSPSRNSIGLEPWPGLWLNIVTDGCEHLLANLMQDGQGVHQATWSSSVYLSYVFHCGVQGEIMMDFLLRKLAEESATTQEIREHLLGYMRRWTSNTPGRQMLIRQFKS